MLEMEVEQKYSNDNAILIVAVGKFGKEVIAKLEQKSLVHTKILTIAEDELLNLNLTQETIFTVLDQQEIAENIFTDFIKKLAYQRNILFIKSQSKLQSINQQQAVFNFNIRDLFVVDKISHIITDLILLFKQECNNIAQIDSVLFEENCECYVNIGCGIGSSESKRIKLAIQSMLSYLTSNSKTYQIRATLLNIHSNKELSLESHQYIENIMRFLVPNGNIVVQESLEKELENKIVITVMMSVKRNSHLG